MNELYELKEKLCDELKEYSHKEISPSTLDVIDKLAHAAKNVDKLIDGGYSNKRDSMGRYSRRGHGYSYHDLASELRRMEKEVPDNMREEVRHLANKMERYD